MAELSCQNVAPRALEVMRQGISDRLHLGVQVYVSRNGQPVIDDAIGEASVGTPLTTSHRLPWRSAGKPITAAAILRWCETGELTLDQAVAEFIPEFARMGKEAVTLRHLLQHTVALEPTSELSAQDSWEGVIDAICNTPIRSGWNTETHAAYEPVRSWFILGEILQIVTGRRYADVIERDWFEPLEIKNSSVLPVGPTNAGELDVPTYVRSGSNLIESPPVHPALANPAYPSPGSSFRGPIRELGKFYEMLLRAASGDQEQLLDAATVQLMTSRHREGRYDETLLHIVDFGLGVICDSKRYGPDTVPYGFGRHASEQTFGHGGVQSVMAFADPQYQLVVAVACNGLPGEPRHQRRFREFLSRLYEDLGLASSL